MPSNGGMLTRLVMRGIELEVKYDVIRRENLNWNLGFNISRNWNRLEKSENNQDFQTAGNGNNRCVIGKPLNGILSTRLGNI